MKNPEEVIVLVKYWPSDYLIGTYRDFVLMTDSGPKLYTMKGIEAGDTTYQVAICDANGCNIQDTGVSLPSTDGHYNPRMPFLSSDGTKFFFSWSRWTPLRVIKCDHSDGTISNCQQVDLNGPDSDLNYQRGIGINGRAYWIARGCNYNGWGVCWRLYRSVIDEYDQDSAHERIVEFVNDSSLSPSQHTYCNCEYINGEFWCACANRGIKKVIGFRLTLDGTIKTISGQSYGSGAVNTGDENLIVIDYSRYGNLVRGRFVGIVANSGGEEFALFEAGGDDAPSAPGVISVLSLSDGSEVARIDLQYGAGAHAYLFVDNDGYKLLLANPNDWGTHDEYVLDVENWSLQATGNSFPNTPIDNMFESVMVTCDRKTYLPVLYAYSITKLFMGDQVLRGALCSLSVSVNGNTISYSGRVDYDTSVWVCLDSEANCNAHNAAPTFIGQFTASVGSHKVIFKSKHVGAPL